MDWVKWQDAGIAETVHSLNKTRKAFCLILVRRPQPADLFDESVPRYHYTVVASNRIERAGETLEWVAQRGETSENRIKELKLGFGMERMPCGQFEANAVFFRLGVLAYNLFQGFKRWALQKEWRQQQVRTSPLATLFVEIFRFLASGVNESLPDSPRGTDRVHAILQTIL
ncbi:MAG: transposase [Methylococcales bacterium]